MLTTFSHSMRTMRWEGKQSIQNIIRSYSPSSFFCRVSNTFCSVQQIAGCDLLFPIGIYADVFTGLYSILLNAGIALNGAVVPAFLKIDDVAQLWYNERSNYDPKKSLLDNVKEGYTKGFEGMFKLIRNMVAVTINCKLLSFCFSVIHYANMASQRKITKIRKHKQHLFLWQQIANYPNRGLGRKSVQYSTICIESRLSHFQVAVERHVKTGGKI